MTIQYIPALLPIFSLFIYAVLFSIECGATLFILMPTLIDGGSGNSGSADAGDTQDSGDDLIRGYINPAWETTNVFLIFALLWLIAFFPGAVALWGRALIVPFLFFLVIMGIRAVGMLYVFYKDGESRSVKFLLFTASFAAPMALAGGVLPYFITGTTSTGMLAAGFAFIALASTLFISVSFFRCLAMRKNRSATEKMNTLAQFSIIIFLSAVCLLIPIINNAAPHLIGGIEPWLPLIILLAILNLIFVFYKSEKYAAGRLALSFALFGAVFFAVMLSQLPYIIYPTITIFSAFTDPASARTMLDALGIAALVIIPSLGWLYYLTISKI